MFDISEQKWKRWVETVNCSTPQPETYAHGHDPGFAEDPDLDLVLKGEVFYQQSIEGIEVVIIIDPPGALALSNMAHAPS